MNILTATPDRRLRAHARATLTDEEAAAYTYEAITRGTDGWNPRKLMEAVSAPANMRYDAASSTLSWDESAYAICYVVTDADDKVVSISTDTSFKPAEGTCGKFTVKAVNDTEPERRHYIRDHYRHQRNRKRDNR